MIKHDMMLNYATFHILSSEMLKIDYIYDSPYYFCQ